MCGCGSVRLVFQDIFIFNVTLAPLLQSYFDARFVLALLLNVLNGLVGSAGQSLQTWMSSLSSTGISLIFKLLQPLPQPLHCFCGYKVTNSLTTTINDSVSEICW